MTATQTPKTPKVDPTRVFDQAIENFETAVKTGCKIQEQAIEQINEFAQRFGSPGDWQQRAQQAAETAVPTLQKNFDEAVAVMNQNARTGLDLLSKAMEAGQTDTPNAAQEKMRDFWEMTLKSMRENTQALVQANTRIAESWTAAARGEGQGKPGK